MTKLDITQTTRLTRWLPYLLIIGGIVGLVCSFIISLDKIRLLENATYTPTCNLNPIISCGSVMSSHQGSVFGFPNPWIGLVAFSVLLTVGMALLAGAALKRWFWIGLQFGTIFGLAFVHWLFFQSVYHIQALCPYCMVIWVVTITTFWYMLLYNFEKGHIVIPGAFGPKLSYGLRRHHFDILALWFLIIIFLILNHFWYYFGKYL